MQKRFSGWLLALAVLVTVVGLWVYADESAEDGGGGASLTYWFRHVLSASDGNPRDVLSLDAAGNMYLDDGVVDSPHFRLIDEGNQFFDMFKEETGLAYFLNNESGLALEMNNDTDDYLYFQTVANVPGITTVGTCNLSITASGGTIDFDDENLVTTGGLTAGTLIWTGVSFTGESPLVFEGATADDYELYFKITDPTGHDKVQEFQNESGLVVLNSTAVTDVAGTHLTVTTKVLNIDDDFLLNTGDAGTGDYDFTGALFMGESPLIFEGASDDTFRTFFKITDPTVSNKTITFQNVTGTVVTDTNDCSDIEGTGLTITTGVLNVDDSYVLNTGDTGTGTYDMTGAVFAGESALAFDGATAGTNKTTLRFTDPTGMRSIAFPDATGMVPVSVTAPVTLSAAGDIGLTVSKDIVAGVGLSGGADDVLTGADADVTLTFAPDEVTGGTTWDDGGEASVVWTWNVTTGDPSITFGNAIVNVSSGALQVGGVAVSLSGHDHAATYVDVTGDTMTGLLQCESPLAASFGKDDATNTAGKTRYWSAGAVDFYADIIANTMTSSATFTLPADEPAGESFLKMGTDGVIDYDASVYLTAEADTLATVTSRGETATADLILPASGKLKYISGVYSTTIAAGTNTQDNAFLLPANDGSASQYLQTDGSGTLSWATVSEADTLATVTARGARAETTCAFESALAITLGKDAATNVAGILKFWSAGAVDFYATLGTPTMSANADFLLPTALPGGESFLKMGTDGQIDFDTAVYLTAEADTLLTVTNRNSTAETTCAFESALAASFGKDSATNTAGKTRYWSAGAVDYWTDIIAGTNTQNNTFTLPVDDGTASQFLQTDGSGVLTWATALTAEAQTLAAVTALGASTAQNLTFTGRVDIDGQSNSETIQQTNTADIDGGPVSINLLEVTSAITDNTAHNLTGAVIAAICNNTLDAGGTDTLFGLKVYTGAEPAWTFAGAGDVGIEGDLEVQGTLMVPAIQQVDYNGIPIIGNSSSAVTLIVQSMKTPAVASANIDNLYFAGTDSAGATFDHIYAYLSVTSKVVTAGQERGQLSLGVALNGSAPDFMMFDGVAGVAAIHAYYPILMESNLAAEFGKDAATNVAGKVKFWSAGAVDFSATLGTPTMSASADFLLPTALPGADSIMCMGTDGQMDFVAATTYLTAEAQTLAAVTALGASTAQNLTFTGRVDIDGQSNSETIQQTNTTDIDGGGVSINLLEITSAITDTTAHNLTGAVAALVCNNTLDAGGTDALFALKAYTGAEPTWGIAGAGDVGIEGDLEVQGKVGGAAFNGSVDFALDGGGSALAAGWYWAAPTVANYDGYYVGDWQMTAGDTATPESGTLNVQVYRTTYGAWAAGTSTLCMDLTMTASSVATGTITASGETVITVGDRFLMRIVSATQKGLQVHLPTVRR